MKRSYHLFEIKGLNQERFFNQSAKKYHLFEINRQQKNTASFKVDFKDRKKVRKELLGAGFEITFEKSGGLLFLLSKFFVCYGLIAGILLSAIIYAIQYQFVQKIEVWGVQETSQIQSFVEKNLPSKNKHAIDTKQIEQQIKDEFDGISFASAAIVGQTLIINVKDSIIPPEMQGEFAPLISQYDGIVTSISLIQGTLRVEVGDIIQKGQILVEGKVTNAQGEVLLLQPKADIVMDIWCEGEETHYDSKMVTYRTGRSKTESKIYLFGKEFYSHSDPLKFDSFEVESFSQMLTNNNILPFKIVKNVYYETKTELVESTFEEKREECVAKAKANCLQKMPDCAIIKNEDYKIIEGAGWTKVRCTITASVKVTGENESIYKQTKTS